MAPSLLIAQRHVASRPHIINESSEASVEPHELPKIDHPGSHTPPSRRAAELSAVNLVRIPLFVTKWNVGQWEEEGSRLTRN